MTSRERVLTAIDLGTPDRVPLDVSATAEVWEKLQRHFGTDDNQVVRERLHIDGFASCAPEYIGPAIPQYSDGTVENFWGMRKKPMQYDTGIYMEQYYYPLAHVKTVAELDECRWPSPDWFDFSTIRQQCEENRDRAIMAGDTAPFYHHNLLRGLEQSLVDLAAEPELSHAVIGRICEFFYGFAERLFEAAGGLLDVSQLTDDFGTQIGLMISVEMFDEYFLAHYKRFAKLFRHYGIRIFHHDDGAMWDLIPRMIDLGVAVLNPVQYKCGPIDPGWLKETYGDRLCFHGGVDNQEVLPFGSVEDVVAETRKCLGTLGKGGGYILAPCHNIQAVTPVENILAMYETAYNEGVY